MKFLETSSGRLSSKFGKPEKYAFEAIINDHYSNSDLSIDEIRKNFIHVGDSLEADIVFANNC